MARYCIRSGNTRIVYNLEDLFGTRSCIASMELPTNIDALVENMPIGTKYTSEYFIYKHTLFPFYAAFIPPERADKIITTMRNGEGAVSYIRMGLLSTSIQLNAYFKFCPECLKEDLSQYGETYWHRIHQVTGVMVCPKHRTPVYNSTELVRGGNRQKYIYPTPENCTVNKEINYLPSLMEKLIFVAEDAEALLNSSMGFREQEWFRNQFRVKLIEAGYALMNNYIYQKRLKSDFVDFYGQDFLELMQCNIVAKGECWLSSLVRDNNRVTHPIRYILLARFLGITVFDLYNTESKICGESSIDKSSKDTYNQLWESRLKELIDMNLSIREMALLLQTTPKTIRRRIDKLGISPFWGNNGGGKFIHTRYTDTDEYIEKRNASRVQWLKLLQENSEMSSNQIRKSNEGLYSWLTRYDNEWLHVNFRKVSRLYSRVDWQKRDEGLLVKVKAVIEEMQQGKPQRICWTTVAGKLGVAGWLSKRKDKLPLTKAYIDSQVESIMDFQIRKIEWAVTELKCQGKEITIWNLIETAGVKQNYIKLILKKF